MSISDFTSQNAVSFLVIHEVIVCLTIDDILGLRKYIICIFFIVYQLNLVLD